MDHGQAMFAGHMDRMVPVPVENRTMAIAPPPGYKDHPPRRWPLIFVVAGVVSAVGVVVLIATQQGTSAEEEKKPAAAAGKTAAPEKPKVAHISLTSRPSSASVYDQAGKFLGTTPVVVELPLGNEEVTLVFRHPEAREREKRLVPSGDAKVDVELLPVMAEPLPAAAPDAGPVAETQPTVEPKKPPRKKKKKRSSDGLLAPTF
jgi:hypothetical protein